MNLTEVIEAITSQIEADLNGRKGLHLDTLDDETLADLRTQWRGIVSNAVIDYRCCPHCIPSCAACGVVTGKRGRSGKMLKRIFATVGPRRDVAVISQTVLESGRAVSNTQVYLPVSALVEFAAALAEQKEGESISKSYEFDFPYKKSDSQQ